MFWNFDEILSIIIFICQLKLFVLLLGKKHLVFFVDDQNIFVLVLGESCLVQCCTTDICNVNCGNNTYFNANTIPGIASSQTKLPTPTASTQSSARTPTQPGMMHIQVSNSTNIQTTAIMSTYRNSQPVTPSITLNYPTPKLPQTTDTGINFLVQLEGLLLQY